MNIRLFDLIRSPRKKEDGYSLALQAARVRAAHQRSYFAPALFNLIPVETDLIGSMAVDAHWRLYYNEAWLKAHSSQETRDGMARFAIPSRDALGVGMKDIKALGKELGRNQELAEILWETGVYEARMLVSLVADDISMLPGSEIRTRCDDE